MPKSQKKNPALNSKPQVISKPGKEVEKTSIKGVKSNNAQPKVVKKAAETTRASGRNSKQSRIVALLQRPAGATVDEMAKATGWQRHSVQGMMSGVLKKRLGLTVTSNKEERGRVYRIAA